MATRHIATTVMLALLGVAPVFSQVSMRSRSAPAAASAPASAPSATAGPARGGVMYAPMRSRNYGMGDPFGPAGGPPMRAPGISGRVLAGGAAPILPVHVMTACSGRMFGLGYTDLRGGFYYPFHMLPMNFGQLAFCDMRFYSPGYWPLTMPMSRYMSRGGYADFGKVELVPYGDMSGTAVSITSLEAPKEAKKAFEKGVKKFLDRDHAAAVEALGEAVTLHPPYAAAWTMLGRAREAQKLLPAARAAYEKAIEADPSYVAPYPALTRLLLARDEMDAVYELSRKGLTLNPADAELQYARALSASAKGKLDDAEYYAQRIVESDELRYYPDALFILARTVKKRGDFARAERLFGEYLAKKMGSPYLRDPAAREMAQSRLAGYTLRTIPAP